MTAELMVTMTAVFITVALVSGSIASTVLGRTAPELKRLHQPRSAAEGPTTGLGVRGLVRATRGATQSLRRLVVKAVLCSEGLPFVGWDDPVSMWILLDEQVALRLSQ